MPSAWASLGRRQVLLPDALFKSISGLESAARIGVVLNKPTCPELNPSLASVILDRVQDAGNVGSILRSAAAMGFTQILALHGTAGLWSPKVLRAAVGAHLSLQLHEDLCVDDLDALDIPILCTSSHQGQYLHEFDQSQPLPNTVAWAFAWHALGASGGKRCAGDFRGIPTCTKRHSLGSREKTATDVRVHFFERAENLSAQPARRTRLGATSPTARCPAHSYCTAQRARIPQCRRRRRSMPARQRCSWHDLKILIQIKSIISYSGNMLHSELLVR